MHLLSASWWTGQWRSRVTTIAVAATSGAVALGCGSEPPQEEFVTRPVKILEIGFGGASGEREYPGTVEAAERTDLAFELPGLVVEMPVIQGQWVGRGQLIARLDERDYEAQRDADAASLEAARADYQRYQELYAADAVTLQDLQLRQAQFEVAEARFRASQKALGDTRLLAPFAGRVARTYVDNYQNVLAKEPVVLLNDDRQLEIVINVPEADALVARSMQRGGGLADIEAEATVSAFSEQRFPAQLREVATQADPVTRTFEVVFSFQPPSDVTLVPGMTARMILRRTAAGGTAETQRLPANAVFGADDGGTAVWKVDPTAMTVSRIPVEVGSLFGDEVEVVRGLTDGDLIAVTGVAFLREGNSVRRLQD